MTHLESAAERSEMESVLPLCEGSKEGKEDAEWVYFVAETKGR